MRFLSFLLVALPLAAALPSPAQGNRGMSRRAGLGDSCRKSSECGSVDNYCRRGRCDVRKPLGNKCYKNIGCISNSCSNKVCTEGAALTLNERCETSKSCQSGYCGKSKCQAPQPEGADCYKAVGCQSGICSNGKCAASGATPTTTTTTTVTPEPTPAPQPNKPTDETGNTAVNGHFEEYDLQPWEITGTGSVKRSEIDNTAYDGQHFAIFKVTSAKPLARLLQEVPPPTSNNGRREVVKPDPNAYDVSFQYKVPELIVAQDGACTMEVQYDGKAPADSAIIKLENTVTDWTKADISIMKPYESIGDIALVLECNGGSATVYVDDVNWVPTSTPTVPGDIALNGGFEDATKDPWVFTGTTAVATTDAQYGAKYAHLTAPGTLAQTLVVPKGSTEESYQAYRVKFLYLVKAFTTTVSGSSCTLASAANDGPAAVEAQKDIAMTDVNDQEYKVYSRVITSINGNAYNDITKIGLGMACETGASAELYIDQVQFIPTDAPPLN